MKNYPALLVLAALCCSSVNAEPLEEVLASRFRAAAAFIDTKMTREAVPGAAIGIVHDQALIWSHQYGVESLKSKTPVTDDTLFSICSVSKLFNGVAAMSLVEAGKLSLDAPLASYLKGVGVQDDTGAEEAVTTRNILSHVSGLPREGLRDYWSDYTFPDAEGLRITVTEQDQLYRPFDYWQYSNLGMAMLGEAIAAVSGKAWGDYVDETIFTPLNMQRSATDMPFNQVGNGFARGYFVRSASGQRKPVEAHSFKAFAPAAGVASSVADMSRFLSWHFRLRENGGEEILKATTLKQMQRVHWMGAEFDEPAWGLAYGARRYGDQTLWGHGGYCPGVRTEFVMRVPSKVGVVMMLTANDVAPGGLVKTVYSLAEDAIAAVYGEEAEKKEAEKKDPATDSDAEISFSEYEGLYLVENYPNDMYVGVTEDGLFALRLLSDDPVSSLEAWVHEDGDRFKRKREDKTLAEAIDFERDDEGRITSLMHHGYRSTKVQR
jgi:CubicO group peptidase (beta-lactamase class C family)